MPWMSADRRLSRVMNPIARFGSRATMSTNTLSIATCSVDVVYAYTLKFVSTTTSSWEPSSAAGVA